MAKTAYELGADKPMDELTRLFHCTLVASKERTVVHCDIFYVVKETKTGLYVIPSGAIKHFYARRKELTWKSLFSCTQARLISKSNPTFAPTLQAALEGVYECERLKAEALRKEATMIEDRASLVCSLSTNDKAELTMCGHIVLQDFVQQSWTPAT